MTSPVDTKAERPPSPPPSNDGDFDLSAVQEHIAGLDQKPRYPLESELPRYGDPSEYQTNDNHVYYTTEGQGFHGTSTPATPPVTSYDNLMRTRSGRAIGSPLTSDYPDTSRRSKSPAARKKRQPRNLNKRTVVLEEPLSVLTKDWEVAVGDIGAKVNRTSADRQAEVHNKKNNGKIPRPMNSFMLYRSAYAERVKAFCKDGNHQIISQVTGASWALEPKAIKDQYEQYADIDRKNHAKAHPDYKFTPNKNGPANKKKRGRAAEDEAHEWEDQEYEERSGRSSGKRSRYTPSHESRSRSTTPFNDPRPGPYGTVAMPQYAHPSSYHASNPRSVPPAYPQEVSTQYYQQYVSPYGNNVEDIRLRRVQHPVYGMYDEPSVVGLPNDGYPELGQQQYDFLDPQLAQTAVIDSDRTFVPAEPQQYEYVQGDGQSMLPYEFSQRAHPGMATLTAPDDPYGEAMPGSEFDEELSKWRA